MVKALLKEGANTKAEDVRKNTCVGAIRSRRDSTHPISRRTSTLSRPGLLAAKMGRDANAELHAIGREPAVTN